METLQRPELRAEFVGGLERRVPPVAAVVAMTRLGRGRTVRSEVARDIAARDIEDAETGEADAMASACSSAGARPSVPRVVARQALTGSGDRLLAEARDACRREGVAATRRELLMRVAKRVGLPQAEVARGLGGILCSEGVAAGTGGFAARHARDPVSRLAAAILGTREREVFLARRLARPDDVAALHALAAGLGLSVERVYELEASARRKLARAMG